MILVVDQILVKDQTETESNFSNLLVAVKAMPAHATHEIVVALL